MTLVHRGTAVRDTPVSSYTVAPGAGRNPRLGLAVDDIVGPRTWNQPIGGALPF